MRASSGLIRQIYFLVIQLCGKYISFFHSPQASYLSTENGGKKATGLWFTPGDIIGWRVILRYLSDFFRPKVFFASILHRIKVCVTAAKKESFAS